MSPEIAEFVTALSKVLSAVAWPLVVLIILATQRKNIQRLLERIGTIKIGKIGVQFHESVEKKIQPLLENPPISSEFPTRDQIGPQIPCFSWQKLTAYPSYINGYCIWRKNMIVFRGIS